MSYNIKVNSMKPFHEIANRIKWDVREDINDYTVGYFDRVEKRVIEMPLKDFLDSDIPEHRARWLKKSGKIVWSRVRK